MLIDGKLIANKIKEQIKNEISSLKIKPRLVILSAGNNPASEVYIKVKRMACDEVGIKFDLCHFQEDCPEEEIKSKIRALNLDAGVTGILVQLPLPKTMNTSAILNEINPIKDVDGLTQTGLGAIAIGNEQLAGCTPKAIIKIIESTGTAIKGSYTVIINRSNLIGKPLALMLLKRDATVTICHSLSKNIRQYTKKADIIVTAAGVPGLIKPDMVKKEAVIIDAGFCRKGNKLYGDADYKTIDNKKGYITPVPGGVGPMTIAMLLENVITAFKLQIKLKKQ